MVWQGVGFEMVCVVLLWGTSRGAPHAMHEQRTNSMYMVFSYKDLCSTLLFCSPHPTPHTHNQLQCTPGAECSTRLR